MRSSNILNSVNTHLKNKYSHIWRWHKIYILLAVPNAFLLSYRGCTADYSHQNTREREYILFIYEEHNLLN